VKATRRGFFRTVLGGLPAMVIAKKLDLSLGFIKMDMSGPYKSVYPPLPIRAAFPPGPFSNYSLYIDGGTARFSDEN